MIWYTVWFDTNASTIFVYKKRNGAKRNENEYIKVSDLDPTKISNTRVKEIIVKSNPTTSWNKT